jgi:hypothetical protein
MANKTSEEQKHELSGKKPTADLLYVLDSGICWLCNKPVEPEQASLDHIVPKYHLGSRRSYQSFFNSALAHKKCNRVRGCPMPRPGSLRWDRLIDEDVRFAAEIVKILVPHWDGSLTSREKMLIGTVEMMDWRWKDGFR